MRKGYGYRFASLPVCSACFTPAEYINASGWLVGRWQELGHTHAISADARHRQTLSTIPVGRGPPCVVVPIAGAAEPGQQGSMKRLPFWFLLPKPCDDEGEGRERGGHGSATDLPHRAGASDRALCLARLRLQYSLQGHCLLGLIASISC